MNRPILWCGPPNPLCDGLSELGFEVHPLNWQPYLCTPSSLAYGRDLMKNARAYDPKAVVVWKGYQDDWAVSHNDLRSLKDAVIGVIILDPTSDANAIAPLVSQSLVSSCDVLALGNVGAYAIDLLRRKTYADIVGYPQDAVELAKMIDTAFAKRRAANLPACCTSKDRLR